MGSLLVIIVSCVFSIGLALGQPIKVSVQTPVGEIVGKLETINFDGTHYNVSEFLGIPYALPPVGGNRFRKPVPMAPFPFPFMALDYGATCLQRNSSYLAKMVKLSEDCLFLNIFVPGYAGSLRSSSAPKLPVMVWIHGGGFVQGSATAYPGDGLSAFGQVIVVNMNYRLAHMGFLRTKETEANFGLWDQHLAIQWVNNNIASFGGDVTNITIFGESAGSSSVVYQVLFPRNKGLFQRAIAESGGITSSWAYSTDDQADDTFKNFTAVAKCTSGTHDDIMSCLRNKTSTEVSEIMFDNNLNYVNVVPNSDGDFVPMHPQQMVNRSKASPASLSVFFNTEFMMGSCSIDGALFLPSYAAALHTDIENFKASRHVYEDGLVPNILKSIFTNVQNMSKTATDMTVYQYTNWTAPGDYMARNFELIKLLTDANMFAPMDTMVQLHAVGSTHKSYMYQFSTTPTTHLLPVPSWLDGPSKANHADDLMFVFGFPDGMLKLLRSASKPINYTDSDLAQSKIVMSLWSNFAKTGNPNTPYVIPVNWPTFDMTSQTYLDITPTIGTSSIKQRIAPKRMAFWLEYLPKLIAGEIV